MQKPCKRMGKWTRNLHLCFASVSWKIQLLVGGTETPQFSLPLPHSASSSSFQGSSADFGSQVTLFCFAAPALPAVHAQHDQGPYLGIFLYNLSFSLEEKTAGASSTVGKYKEMHKNCRNINWNNQTEKSHHLGGFRDNTGDFTLIFGRKIGHCLGIISFRYWFFFVGKWHLGLHNPPRNNGSQLKISQKVARHLLALFPQGRQMPGAFYGFSRHFEGGGKEKKNSHF